MSLLLSGIFELIKTYHSSKTSLDQEVMSEFMVMPSDIDFNGHMTNHRYHSIMDKSAIKFLASHGILRAMFKHQWRPIVGSCLISHRGSLKIFNRYQVYSKIVYCDTHWCYLSHRIVYKGKLIAAANRKYAFVNTKGFISTDKIFRAINQDYTHRPNSKQFMQSLLGAERNVLQENLFKHFESQYSAQPNILKKTLLIMYS